MAFDYTDDLGVFFNDDDFAIIAVTPYGDRRVKGVLAESFEDVRDPRAPVFICAERDVSDMDHGDQLIINDVTYSIQAAQPDGTGIIALQLTQI